MPAADLPFALCSLGLLPTRLKALTRPGPTHAAGASDLVVDSFTLTPPGIEKHFGITGGHIHHVDNSFGFSDRFPYRTPVQVGASGSGARRGAGMHEAMSSCGHT